MRTHKDEPSDSSGGSAAMPSRMSPRFKIPHPFRYARSSPYIIAQAENISRRKEPIGKAGFHQNNPRSNEAIPIDQTMKTSLILMDE
jgi:hypothetical protein